MAFQNKTPEMKYNEVLDYILQMEKFGIKLGLSNITRFFTWSRATSNSRTLPTDTLA